MESPAKIIVEHCDTSLDDDSDVGSPEVSVRLNLMLLYSPN